MNATYAARLKEARDQGKPFRRLRAVKRFDWADVLAQQIRAMQLPEPQREYRFDPTRRWRLDLAWPDRLVYLEADGGEYVRGSRRHGGANDCQKQNAAVLAGWTPFRVTGSMIRSGEAIDLLITILRDADHGVGAL